MVVAQIDRAAGLAAIDAPPWHVTGSYFEACNCQPICPCRRRGGQKPLGGPTYGVCDFALSWQVLQGAFGRLSLDGLNVIMAGSYREAEPGSPWRVCLYVDERASSEQHAALAAIFCGHAGGTALRNYASVIGEVYAVRRAQIELDHRRHHWSMRADNYVAVRGATPVESPLALSCAIPGHDRPGEELRTEVMQVNDSPLIWGVQARCGFATSFAYHSED
jgi:hypothetical protein